jgi:hypothetical protein
VRFQENHKKVKLRIEMRGAHRISNGFLFCFFQSKDCNMQFEIWEGNVFNRKSVSTLGDVGFPEGCKILDPVTTTPSKQKYFLTDQVQLHCLTIQIKMFVRV